MRVTTNVCAGSAAKNRRFLSFFATLFIFCCVFMGLSLQAHSAIPVILDTDLATDCDDAAALAMLHRWADAGDVTFLAVGVSTKNQYNVLCVDAINTWYGRGTLPIGVTKNAGAYTPSSSQVKYAQQISQEYPRTNTSWTQSNHAPDVISVYRQVLAAQPNIDGSNPGVVIISIGMLTNISDLLQSGPCAYSSLNGTQLVQDKVRLWSCMGGRFTTTNPEYNIVQHLAASQYAIGNWPKPLVMSPGEVGDAIYTGSGLVPLPSNHILRRVYELSGYLYSGRQSWDQCACLYAVLGIDGGPAANHWTLSNPGTVTVQSNGRTTWASNPLGLQQYKTIPPNVSTNHIAEEIEWFMIGEQPPVYATYPVSQTVSAGSAVEFSVSVSGAATYQWYKDGTQLTGSSGYSGQTTANLTIFNAQVSDEGYYYCVIDGNTPVPDDQKARLMIRRLVGWWKLDNNPNDSIREVYPTVPKFDGQTASTPTYVDSPDGKAIQFYGNTANHFVNMTGSSGYYNFYPQGYTVSAWVKVPPSATGTWRSPVSKEYCWGIGTAANFFGYALFHNQHGHAVFTQRRSSNDLSSGFQICDNNWHLVTGTWDASERKARVYVDGLLRATSPVVSVPAVTSPSERFIVRIGADADRYSGQLNSPFVGLVDDVRIYSYPLNAREVAFLHNSFDICETMPEYDLSGPYGVPDCKVDFYDFAELAADWMDGYAVSDLALLAEEWLKCNLVSDCFQP